jgi:DNA-binding CsgD family transcriptional regulator
MTSRLETGLDNSRLTRALLDPLYDAATQPELCDVFLKKATEVLRSDTAAFVVYAPTNGEAAVRVDRGYSEEMRQDCERLIRISPWAAEIEKFSGAGTYSGSPEDVLSPEAFRKSAFYNDFFRKHNIEWANASIVFGPGGSQPGLVVTRSRTGEAYSKEDKELMRQLLPHLGRVFKVYRAVTALRLKNAAGHYALDLIGAACIVLDSKGRALSLNRRAEALVAHGGVLRLKHNRLATAVAAEQNELDACIVPACACGDGKSVDPGTGAVVLHSTRGEPLFVSILPYHSGVSLLEDRPAALVFITTPDEQGTGEHRLWQSMFGLSPAECRVAEMMKQGMDAAEISEAIRIKLDTVRYYQKCVYRKTGVRGQGQLMRLLTRLPSSGP